jgi:hypothetical protein
VNLYKVFPSLISPFAMSPSPSTQVGPASAAVPSQAPLQPRPLRREGAVVFQLPTAGEQEMEDAMLQSSSPPPESVLGKRAHREDEPGRGSDTEVDEEDPSTIQPQLAPPSIRNVTGFTQQYVSKKKLRPEQRDEVDTFLLVRDFIAY